MLKEKKRHSPQYNYLQSHFAVQQNFLLNSDPSVSGIYHLFKRRCLVAQLCPNCRLQEVEVCQVTVASPAWHRGVPWGGPGVAQDKPQAHWGSACGQGLSAPAPCPWAASYLSTCTCPYLAHTNLQLRYSRISMFTAKPEDLAGLWWVLRFRWPDTPGRGGASACPVEVTRCHTPLVTVGAAVTVPRSPQSALQGVWGGGLRGCCLLLHGSYIA